MRIRVPTPFYQFLRRVLRAINLTLGSALMVFVALIAAFLAMRIVIHGREVTVPNFAGMSDADAAAKATSLGLNLQVESRYYSSAVAANHVLSQAPLQGNSVRRGWQVRVTESLGGQQVAIPNVTGQQERAASVSLRRLALDVTTSAYLPVAVPAGLVLAQSPPPDSKSAEGPGVSLLVTADPTPASSYAFVMPSLIGLTVGNASAKLGTAGLHIASTQDAEVAEAVNQAITGTPAPIVRVTPGTALPVIPSLPGSRITPIAPLAPIGHGDVAFRVPSSSPAPVRSVIVSQTPLPGHKVTRADNIRVTLSH
jgi:beta-lactam-binding protein with PASTA domain